jgi:beta-galactosidase
MRRTIDLNQNWAFRLDAEVPKVFPEDWDTVDLPHTWNALDGQDGGNDYRRTRGVYVKRLPLKPLDLSKVFLEINGCNSSCEVWLDGKLIAAHDGGYSTFRCALPVVSGDELLTIVADNRPSDRVYPQQADFTFYGGFYRSVRLILLPKAHFELVKDGTPGIAVKTECLGANYKVVVETEVTGGKYVLFTVDGQKQRVPVKNGRSSAEFILENSHLWDGLNDPYLYEATAVLIDENGHMEDQVQTSFGCRTVAIDPEKGFLLNGRPYPLRGVSRHQDRQGLGNALTKKEHDEDMALIREIGANSVRLAHYQHDQYFYDLCDRYGLIAWAEIPYISAHMAKGRENTFSQMRELITQCRNHPSIAVWGLSNEITMSGITDDLRENHDELNRLVKAMDPSRPTVMANVMMLEVTDPLIRVPDAVAYNIYFGWYVGELGDNDRFFDDFHRKNPDVPIGFSEYGCDTNPAFHTSTPKRGDYTEEYQLVYHEHILKLIEERPWLWCTYAWNMFDFAADARDEGGMKGINQKGLVTFDRKLKKDAFYLYKAHWSEEPFVHVCGRRYVNRAEEVTEVKVLSNQKTVALYMDGIFAGEKSGNGVFTFQLPITGTHCIEAVSGALRDEITIRRVDTPDESYVLKSGGILNWFDASGLKTDCFSLKDRVCDMMKNEAASKVVIGCVNRPGKDESDFIRDLRAHPEKLETLELSMEEVLDRASPFISANIKRHVNAAFQQIRKQEEN